MGCLGNVHGATRPRSILISKHLFDFKKYEYMLLFQDSSVFSLLAWLMRPFPAMRAPGRRWLSCALSCCLRDAQPTLGKGKAKWHCLQPRWGARKPGVLQSSRAGGKWYNIYKDNAKSCGQRGLGTPSVCRPGTSNSKAHLSSLGAVQKR